MRWTPPPTPQAGRTPTTRTHRPSPGKVLDRDLSPGPDAHCGDVAGASSVDSVWCWSLGNRSRAGRRGPSPANGYEPGCSLPPCQMAPASGRQCPRQESNLVFDLRQVACKSPTLRGRVLASAPRRGMEPRLAVPETAVLSDTPAGLLRQYPHQDSNLALELRRLRCDPRHHRDTDQASRRLGLHLHRAVDGTAAFLFGHVGKHEREGSNPVRQGWNLPALPGARSCTAPGPQGPRALRVTTTSATQRSSKLR